MKKKNIENFYKVTICPECGKGKMVNSDKYNAGGDLRDFFKILAKKRVRLLKINYKECEDCRNVQF